MLKTTNYQIVFSDVDGTLLNKDRELSDVTVHQIKRIVNERNIKFVMVSARMPSGMQHLYNQLSVKSPIICYNGALILSALENGYNKHNVLHSCAIDYPSALSIYAKAKDEDLHFGLFSNNRWFANRFDEWTAKEENNTRVKCTINPQIENLIAELQQSKEPIHKLMVMGNSSKIDSFMGFTNSNFGRVVASYRSKDTYIEISPVLSNKATGCSFLMDYLKIPYDKAIAFGDNLNDIEMLKIVGLGIAMQNAPDTVKNHANRIAPSNTNNGVANTISELFIE